jgi:hypothetical protein
MSNREGIEIDYCPQCRGVWLDRGELDKIIERTAVDSASAAQGEPARRAPDPRYAESRYGESRYGDDDDHRYRDQSGYHKRKRKGLLGDLFDFD